MNTDKYVVQELKTPENMYSPEFAEIYKSFSNRILWMDKNNVEGAFQMNTAWYYAVPPQDPIFPVHSHGEGEIIGFFSNDPENPYELGAEIWFGIDGEMHKLTKSTLMYIPPNLPHGPMSIKSVDRPVFHFSTVTGGEYIGGAYSTD